MTALMPLSDVTNKTNILRDTNRKVHISTEPKVTREVNVVPTVFRHDPYNWSYLASNSADNEIIDASAVVCVGLVQHKCHTTECASPFMLGAGQYVVIRGDRGIDVGVVVRVSTNLPPSSSAVGVLRYATQREVDFWSSDLKAMEAVALEYCRQRIQRHKLAMDVRHAEYQFDQKKLTFYFDAAQRVDFVIVLRELYREFGCRIWMEKTSAM